MISCYMWKIKGKKNIVTLSLRCVNDTCCSQAPNEEKEESFIARCEREWETSLERQLPPAGTSWGCRAHSWNGWHLKMHSFNRCNCWMWSCLLNSRASSFAALSPWESWHYFIQNQMGTMWPGFPKGPFRRQGHSVAHRGSLLCCHAHAN